MTVFNRQNLILLLKGMAMGAADVVPGVSGGTIALISGIYQEFVDALKSFSSVIPILLKDGVKAAWKHVHGDFLVVLFSGILLSFLSLVQLIKYSLENHPILLWSFFFGLILASSYFVGKKIQRWNFLNFSFLFIGTAAIYLVTEIGPSETGTALWLVFLSGMIAICAMILPGISGAFILVLLGKYKYIIESIVNFKIDVILTFVIGCVFGLLSFSHLLSYLLRKHYDLTIALLTGFMIGSLNKIWPWKNTLEWGTDRHGEKIAIIQENVLPNNYSSGEDQLLWAVCFLIFGFASIFILEKWADKTRIE